MCLFQKNRWLFACLPAMLVMETSAQESPLPSPLIRFRDTIATNLPFGTENKAIFRLDSSIHYQFSLADSEWVPSISYRYYYLEDGKLKSYIYYTGSGAVWMPQQQTLYHYQDGFLSMMEKQLPNGENWKTSQQTIYERSPSGKVLVQLTRAFDTEAADWKNQNRYLFDYNTGEQLVKRTYQVFSGSEWVNGNRFLYTYLSGVLHEMVRQNWNAALTDWVNDTRSVYSYTAGGEFLYEVQYHWEGGTDWIPGTRISFALDGWGEVIEKLYEQYDTDSETWLPVISYVYLHEKPGMDTAIVYRIWNKDIPEWDEKYRYLFSYDPHGNLTSEIWQKKTSEWINDYRIDYFGASYPAPLRVEITDSTNASCYDYSDGEATALATGGIPPYIYLWDDPAQSTGPLVGGLPAGVWIHVVVTDAAMNTATDSVLLSEPPPVITGEIEGPVIVTQGDTLVYVIDPNHTSIYTWEVEGGYVLSGQGTPDVEIVWTSSGSACVKAWETNAAGCPGDTSILCVDVRPVFLNTLQPWEQIRIFPNPGYPSAPVYVDFPIPFTGRWEVYDSFGRVVLSGEIRDVLKAELFINQLSPGYYLIRFRGTVAVNAGWISR